MNKGPRTESTKCASPNELPPSGSASRREEEHIKRADESYKNKKAKR